MKHVPTYPVSLAWLYHENAWTCTCTDCMFQGVRNAAYEPDEMVIDTGPKLYRCVECGQWFCNPATCWFCSRSLFDGTRVVVPVDGPLHERCYDHYTAWRAWRDSSYADERRY